jgi:hypothetical protein
MAPIGVDIEQISELLVRPARKAMSDCAKKLRRCASHSRWNVLLAI